MCQHGEYCDILVEGKILNKLSVPGKYLELALGMSADFAKFNQNFGVIFDWKGKLREKWKGKMKRKNEGKMRGEGMAVPLEIEERIRKSRPRENRDIPIWKI